ncbi:MAG: type II toxin-antitoxin system RelE/ParE family toxin [Gammaproteobacteria bacterium]|nr:type II toxin-antitoxin system RelE/ParE family toxin [Gammaproteobacteria bacterium]
MPMLIISPEAEQDLLDIWLYIAEDSSVNAGRFLDRLEGKALKLTEFTEIGIDRPELAADLKSFPVDRYVLYYRVNTGGIELVRVLHGSRDINRAF